MSDMNKTALIKKLQTAINLQGYRLLYCTSEFYSIKHQRPVIMYVIKNAELVTNENDKLVTNNLVIFKSASQLRAVFFLRDVHEAVKCRISLEEAIKIAQLKQKDYKTKHDLIEEGVSQ